jgi:molybdenum cofactor cytidylyltransferase
MICAIVPAAGQSHRMGTAKQLLPWGSSTILGHIVDQLRRSRIDEIYVVVGHQAERIVESLPRQAVCIVDNPSDSADMLSSVRCGLRALPLQCQAIMVALGDQPAITRELIDAMIQSFGAKASTSEKGIVVPTYGGKRGHPLLFSAQYSREILQQYDATGLRGLLLAHRDEIYELSVSNPGVLADIDDPADYARETQRLASNSDAFPRSTLPKSGIIL